MQKKTKTFFYFLIVLLCSNETWAQLPTCPSHIIYINMDDGSIYNYNLDQAIVAGINPVLNTIHLPPNGYGLAVSPNLNAAIPAVTFYTVVGNGGSLQFYYYDGSTWVNTNHAAGTGGNIGAGGGYIYNYRVAPEGPIWRYDGTGDATLLMNTGTIDNVADVAVDCSGNFYILQTISSPQSLKKFNSAGVLINTYSLTGAPLSLGSNGGGGLVVVGNNVYYDTPNFMRGTISGNTVNFSFGASPVPLTGYVTDMASCPGLPTPTQVFATICANQSSYNWNGNSYSAAGTYTITLPASNGCDSLVTLNLSTSPVITGVPQNISICQNQLPYHWNGNNYSSAGNYTTTLTAGNGCDSIAVLNLTITNPAMSTPQNISVCSNQLPYSWNGNNYNTAGNYTATLTGINGCDSIATLNLTIKPVTTGVPQNINICPGQLPYIWNGANYNTAGSYTAMLTGSNGCDSIATLNLNIKQNSFTAIDTSICPDQLPYHWNGNQYALPGPQQQIFTAANGCDSVVTVNLSLFPPAVAFAGNDDSTQYNVPYQLSGSGGTEYEWSPAAVLNNAYIANPLAMINNSTTFYLNIKDDNGCIGRDTVNIKMPSKYPVFVPAAFSPNGDFLNDVFRPILIDIKQLNYFRVYNRYGQMVFQSNNVTTGWDGTYKGAKQDIGTYTWILEAVDIKGKVWKQQGTIVLLR